MGLFTEGADLKKDSENYQNLLNGIGDYIIANPVFNIEKFEFGSKSIDRACLLASEYLFNDREFPSRPGPFKRAAATAILTKTVLETAITPKQAANNADDYNPFPELNCWKARVAYLTIAPIINASSIDINKGREKRSLSSKPWMPPTNHVKVELIAFLRWLDNFSIRKDDGAIHAGRLCRSVMALAMIIEQAYYLVGAKTNCNIMGLPDCVPPSENRPEGWDLWFDTHE